MLSTKNLPLKTGRSKKLSPKFLGPFTITERLASGNAYRLELPHHLRYIHDVFNASLLKPFHTDETRSDRTLESSFVAPGKKIEIEKILSHRIKNGDMQFLVHFRVSDPIEHRWINKEMNKIPLRLMKEYQDGQFAKALEDDHMF